jgi:hypothetical protein
VGAGGAAGKRARGAAQQVSADLERTRLVGLDCTYAMLYASLLQMKSSVLRAAFCSNIRGSVRAALGRFCTAAVTPHAVFYVWIFTPAPPCDVRLCY